MRTGEDILCHFTEEGTSRMVPVIWCDICGWGAEETDEKYHFCHRHSQEEIRKFMAGDIVGYFEKEAQEELDL